MSRETHRTPESFENALSLIIKSYTEGECDLEEVINMADRVMCYKANVGISVKRLEHNERERAFHDQWLQENAPVSYVNHGHGILQDLFIEGSSMNLLGSRRVIEEISNRDRQIVATVIQWLGSNCGMCFLSEALSRFGAKITYDSKP